MDIKEMTKNMTREEFMEYNKITSCPRHMGLKDSDCKKVKCRNCWENAIKNIKFKGEDKMSIYNEDMLEKVLEGRNNKILVHFNSREDFKSILKLCEDRKIQWASGDRITVKDSYMYDGHNMYMRIQNHWTTMVEPERYGNTYEIIEYKDLLKKDYDKEYTIQELFDFKEGTEFITLDYAKIRVKIEGAYIYQKVFDKWEKSCLCKEWLTSKFKLSRHQTDWSKVEVDTRVLVRQSDEDNWERRHFAEYKDGCVYTFSDGLTSFSNKCGDTEHILISWEQAKLYEEE